MTLCLGAGMLDAARAVADSPIYDVDGAKETGLTSRDALQYFYSAGLLYMSLRDWHAAAASFRTVLLIPANALSALAVEAFKKWVILSILAAPMDADSALELPSMPPTASPAVIKGVDRPSAPYAALARAAVTLDRSAVLRVASEHEAVFVADRNLDLVQGLIDNVARRCVVRLSRTYVSVPMLEVASAVGTGFTQQDANELARSMIAEGQLAGNIDPGTGTLVFLGDSAAAGSSASSSSHDVAMDDGTVGAGISAGAGRGSTLSRLYGEVEQLTSAVARLRKADDDLSVIPGVLRAQMKAGELPKGGRGGKGSGMGFAGMTDEAAAAQELLAGLTGLAEADRAAMLQAMLESGGAGAGVGAGARGRAGGGHGHGMGAGAASSSSRRAPAEMEVEISPEDQAAIEEASRG
jgi:hypothetical protein